MQDNVPITSEPGRHGIADVLRLMSAVRRIAHDRTLPASEALGRIRDRSASTTAYSTMPINSMSINGTDPSRYMKNPATMRASPNR
jgi:hypothetical protein